LQKINRLISDAIKGLQTVTEIQTVLQNLASSKVFHEFADLVAHRFVTLANTTDAKIWREAARGGSQGNAVYKALQKTLKTNVGAIANQKIVENAQFIKSMPLFASSEITKHVANEVFKGLRTEEIAKDLSEKVWGLNNTRANLIARTESSKTMTALTEARAKDVGVNWYIWKTANDGNRVRESHQNMQGVLVRWDNPPAPEILIGEKSQGHYNAGEIYNCRCYARPLISLNNVEWPARVYYNGSIKTMSKLKFEKIM